MTRHLDSPLNDPVELNTEELKMLFAIGTLPRDSHIDLLIAGIHEKFGVGYDHLRKLVVGLRKKGLIVSGDRRGYRLSKRGEVHFKEMKRMAEELDELRDTRKRSNNSGDAPRLIRS